MTTANQTRSIAGTVFSDGKPRFIQIKGINLDADVGSHMVYITNTDVPGMIGFIGTTLGEAGVNIANFQLGRDKQGGDAIALLYVDGPVARRRARQADAPTRRSARPSRWSLRSNRLSSQGSTRSRAPGTALRYPNVCLTIRS